VLHDAGPATAWAAQAKTGQFLGVGGPRGSLVIPDDFDWYLFVGDETALPAIGRRLEELAANTRVLVVAEIADRAEEQQFASRAAVEVQWLYRNTAAAAKTSLLQDALAGLSLPAGEGYAWVATEAAIAKALRQYLVEQRGLDKERVKAAAYWKRGAIAVHETYND
jgi:NADPH-dependent ferric siderophore reductase